MNKYSGRYTQLFSVMLNYPELDLYDRVIYAEIYAFAHVGENMKKKNSESTEDKPKVLITAVHNQTISEKTGISERKVSSTIHHLQCLGIISIKPAKRKYARYIKIERDFALPQPEQVEVEEEYLKLYQGMSQEEIEWEDPWSAKEEQKKVEVDDDDFDF